MYKKVDTSLDFVKREEEVIKFWKENDVFNKSVKQNEGKEEFSFYDGPPTANGMPHIGHVLTRSIKDIIPRYKTMKGYHVLRKAGWDTHGLPVELEVEKQLNLDGKKDIEKYGIEPFIKKCKESVWKYKSEWETMSDRVGFWADMDNPYITYEDNYIESVWWALKTIADKGLIYKGHKIVPYCPRCGTALSSHEVAQGYKDVKEKSIFVKFRSKDDPSIYFLAWTTTPWTLPSNVALCMNAKEDYSLIEVDGEKYILASALIPSLFEEGTYKVLETKKGKDYERKEYVPLFDYVAKENEGKAFYITNGEFVTLTDGTGIVHIAPAFGEDDANVGKEYNLPFVQLVDGRGCFKDEAYDIKGIFAKDADKLIIEKLKNNGTLFKELLYEHSYPFCWRCDTPLLYYARSSWFIKVTAIKDILLKSNASVNWMPSTIGTGRMGNFLENAIDWGISRERYWGTPLPFWVCDKCGKVHVIGSKKELKDLTGKECELHRPYIDDATFKCECGGTYRRTPEVLDCWFDSGSMPFAQYHYPFENKETFEKTFPANFISEAVDQTRGWFYTLLAISSLLFEKAPFENCIVLGHVNDKNGIKMSKHKGNVVDPWSALNKQGADAVRWYFYTGSNPWLPSRFYDEAVSEAQRKFLGTLWNTYAFFVLYAEIDKYDPTKYTLKDCKLNKMDKWLISELNSLIKFVDLGLSNYQITETARKIQEFTDNLSNWYVRRCRERYWGSGMTDDKIAAYTTLYTALVTLAKLSAPYTPFMAESIYQNLVPSFFKDAPISVHLCSFPEYDESLIDEELGRQMGKVIEIVQLGRAARNLANIKNRQPLQRIYVHEEKIDLSSEMLSIMAEELNVKEFETVKDLDTFISYELKPQLKTIGPKYGSLLNKIREFLNTTTEASNIVKAVENGTYEVTLDGTKVEFTKEDLLISPKQKEGYCVVSENGKTAILDTTLTDELIDEGIEREVVSKVQTMRKDSGFEVTDHIKLFFKADGHIKDVIIKNKDSISSDVLANEVLEGERPTSKEWEINGDTIKLAVEKV